MFVGRQLARLYGPRFSVFQEIHAPVLLAADLPEVLGPRL